MSNHWLEKYNLEFVTTVVDVTLDGVKLGLTETEAGVLTALLHGPVRASKIGKNPKVAAVIISHLRAKLADFGLPIAIRNTNGNIGRPGPRDPQVHGGSYYLAEMGEDANGRINATNGRDDVLQGTPGGAGS